jgi:short subunit dehydrogenase-like uncharacterized protein
MNHPHTDYDLVVWGATGFTGRLVVEYLLEKYGVNHGLIWAIAGRNASKLAALKKKLGSAADNLAVLTADSHDVASLEALVSSTRVIITTVGPYMKYGSELVAACAESGTHYCDLTGEVQFMRKMIDQHQAAAQKSGARIVHACGFDSVPSDMGVFYLQKESEKRFGKPCNQVKTCVRAIRGGASGGTIDSMMSTIDQVRKDSGIGRILVDPYSLCPPDFPRGPDKRDQKSALKDDELGAWTAPFVMAGVNTKVVRRSNALMDGKYGPDFSYSENMWAGPGLSGYLKAIKITAALFSLVMAGSVSVLRKAMLKTFLPEPGQGPDRKARESGFYNFIVSGKSDSGDSITVRVKGDRDPGYGSTSKILGECGVCLALDELPVKGGFWTPASAMGDALLKRLPVNAGLTFSVEEKQDA